ncbi:hypothetical protein [Microbacterium sp. NPDC055665]
MADVELLAVSKITELVARCPHLAAQIASNDKTPFTDGHIDVYEGLSRSKADWRGRVDVQVKGRKTKGLLATFPVTRTDLLAFQRNAGVLYFVVTIHPKTLKRTAYFAVLSPFGIEGLLAKADRDQKTISIPLTTLTSDPTKLESVVALALNTKRQNTSTGFDPALFDQIASLTVHSVSDLSFDGPLTLDSSRLDVALEMTTTSGMQVPLGGRLEIVPAEYTQKRVAFQIRCGDIAYDECSVRRLDSTRVAVALAGGLTIIFKEEAGVQTSSFTLTLAGNFADELKALEFFSAVKTTRTIELDGRKSTYEMEDEDEDDSLERQLRFMRRLQDLFTLLEVDTTLINLEDVSDSQLRELMNVYRSLIEGEEPTNKTGAISRFVISVAEWHLMFLLMPGSTEGHWRLVDPFDSAAPHMYRYDDEDDPSRAGVPVTVYDTVEDEYFATVLNLRLSAMVDAYEALTDQPTTLHLANLRVIALISAADGAGSRRGALLAAAQHLNDWLIAQDRDLDRHYLNRYQILWRTGSLTSDDLAAIREMKRQQARLGDAQSLEFEIACALLLDDAGEVAHLEKQLEPDRLAMMEAWPIWYLHPPRSSLREVEGSSGVAPRH